MPFTVFYTKFITIYTIFYNKSILIFLYIFYQFRYTYYSIN